jgi:hypothetical protein
VKEPNQQEVHVVCVNLHPISLTCILGNNTILFEKTHIPIIFCCVHGVDDNAQGVLLK